MGFSAIPARKWRLEAETASFRHSRGHQGDFYGLFETFPESGYFSSFLEDF